MTLSLLALGVLAALTSAPRPSYGGVVVTPGVGRDPISLADGGQSLTALSLALATFERLYRQDESGLVPELAESLPSTLSDGRIFIALRRNLQLHDGRSLGPEELRQAIASFAEPGSGRAHLLLPILGAKRGSPPPVEVPKDRYGIAFPLRLGSDSMRLLASARSGIRVPSKSVAANGTGPFRIGAWSGTEVLLLPFPQHRSGRPYLDQWRVRLFDTAFSARDELSRDRAAVAFGPIEGEAVPHPRLIKAGAPPRLLTYLRVGAKRPELSTVTVFRAMEQAIDRQRLVRRYLRSPADVAQTLTGADMVSPLPALGRPALPQVRATMLLAEHTGPGRRFAERLQLDLVRAGVNARLEVVSERELLRRRKTQDFDLALDQFLFEGEPNEDGPHQLFGLLALAASLESAEGMLSDRELAAFFAEGGNPAPTQRSLLSALDRRLRDEALLIPLVIEEPTVHIVGPLKGVRSDPSGAPRLEDAELGASP